MDNKEFDDIIKKKLESLNTNGSEDAWDIFKEKWQNESVLDDNSEELSSQDKDLEAKIKKDMQGLRMPFNSKHWIILKAQLESEALFKKKLFVAKSVELVVLAFLVLGILNLWPIQKDIYQIPVYDIPMVASVPVDTATAEKHNAQEQARVAKQNSLNNRIFASTKKLVQTAITAAENLSINQNFNSIEKELIENTNRTNNTTESDPSNLRIDQSIQLPFINSIDKNHVNQEALNNSEQDSEHLPIASLQNKEIEYLDIPLRPLGFSDLVLGTNTLDKKENTYVSFAIGPKMNLINSPFDPVYELVPYNTINTNFNISAKVHKEIGPIELYAGLGYTNTSYVPRLVEELYEPLESQFNVALLENIEFKTFNIPLGVKFNIAESKNIEFYTTAGIDMNIIADSEYTIQDKPANAFPGPAPAAPGTSPNSNSLLSEKEFNKGILSGGSLKDNLYASASIGLGLNWKTSARSGLFIEPRYSHFISSKGIGPNEDKVHSLSINIGVKYQLN